MNDASETKPARTLITSSNSSMARRPGGTDEWRQPTPRRVTTGCKVLILFWLQRRCSSLSHLMRGQVALGLSLVTCIAAIGYAHFAQVEDRRLMHEGVVRDKARLKEQRREAKRQQRAQEK